MLILQLFVDIIKKVFYYILDLIRKFDTNFFLVITIFRVLVIFASVVFIIKTIALLCTVLGTCVVYGGLVLQYRSQELQILQTNSRNNKSYIREHEILLEEFKAGVISKEEYKQQSADIVEKYKNLINQK